MQAPDSVSLLNVRTAIAVVALVLLSVCPAAFPQTKRGGTAKAGDTSASKSSGNALERGKYIVEDVAICSQCHTPRDNNGTSDRSHWLQGAAVWFRPAEPAENWPLQAPRIAGDPPGTDAEMVTLLTTGIWKDGNRLRPPMPQFRLTRQDAEAVVAYLKSLGSGAH